MMFSAFSAVKSFSVRTRLSAVRQQISAPFGERMRKVICCALFALATTFAPGADKRPKITGIDHVDFYTTSPEANARLYMQLLGLMSGEPLEQGQTQRFLVGEQFVGYRPASNPSATDRMDHVAFATDNCAALRNYLAAKGLKVPESLSHLKEEPSFFVKDAEGHKIEFVERRIADTGITGKPVSRHIIHAGFIVHDRAAEDHFYRDILGFHLYWQGGMQTGKNDWVAMQVPDGTDWLEYMLNVEPNADQHTMGVMNHISLGVRDIKGAQAKLESHGWKPHGEEKAQMGRDGKWQLNLYDPDFTRIELMEFKPAQKPCCSEFQGKHPSD
jgi:catechol 2,3-dioxygenase-like lactoylglutathione lyase family enzyme